MMSLLGLCLAACAHTDGAAGVEPAGDSLTGWITFRGEFLLYPRREDIGRTFDETCVSGTFARRQQYAAAARRFEGKHVRIQGTLLPADHYFSETGLGQPIENYCASKQVLIATGIAGESVDP